MAESFENRVQTTISRHSMILPGDRVLAGVSGGADSVCLLLVLRELGYDPAVAHLNHGLRGAASDEDEHFVEELAGRIGAPFLVKRISLSSPSAGHGNIEAAGREARKAFFQEIAAAHGFTKTALAHTRDDRIETFLMNLLRGSGLEGMVSMPPVSGPTIRPLIESSRGEVEFYLRQKGQSWRTDATNFDLSFARNRLRHEVIPMLVSGFNVNLAETLSRTIHILEGEEEWLHRLADDWIGKHGTNKPGGLVLDCRALESAPAGLVRRAVRTALRRAGSTLQDVSFDHIEAVRSLVGASKSGKIVEIPGGLIVAREFDRLVVRIQAPPVPDYEYELKIPGHVRIPELGKVFRAEVVDGKRNQSNPMSVLLDAGSLGPCVRIRNWKPGDYYRPVGLPAGKLKKLFQRARIPRSQRGSWPVFVTDTTIIWVASFPVSRDFAPGERSQKIVAIEALPE